MGHKVLLDKSNSYTLKFAQEQYSQGIDPLNLFEDTTYAAPFSRSESVLSVTKLFGKAKMVAINEVLHMSA